MNFSERLKKLRESKGLSQKELAERSGLSTRMVQKYEGGESRPRYEAAEKVALALEIPISQLLGEDNVFVAQAAERYGSRGAKQAEKLMSEVTGLFAGGEMAEEDMDTMMKLSYILLHYILISCHICLHKMKMCKLLCWSSYSLT